MRRVLTFHTQPLHMYRHQLERNKIYRTNLSLNLYYPTIRHRGMHADLPHSNSPHASSLIMKKQALPIPIKPGPLAFCLEPTLIWVKRLHETYADLPHSNSSSVSSLIAQNKLYWTHLNRNLYFSLRHHLLLNLSLLFYIHLSLNNNMIRYLQELRLFWH